MPLSSNLNTYADVAAVLEPVANAGGRASYELPTPGKAIRWRQRAYKYRELLQKELQRAAHRGAIVPRTPYDTMRLDLKGPLVLIDMVPEPEGMLHLPGGASFTPRVPGATSATAVRPLPTEPVEDLTTMEAMALALIQQEGKDD